ncbi:hypothetical protein [Nocardioides dilutus]
MTEPQILQAYRSLSAPTAPPDDLLAGVGRRIRRRRTMRRALVSVAAVAVAAGTATQVLGGSDGGDRVANDPGTTDTSSLTYTDTDGSTYTWEAKDIGLACATSERDGKAFQVLTLTSNAMLQAAAQDVAPPEETFTGPVLHVELLTEKVRPGQTFDLPYESVDGSSDRRTMTFFFTNGVTDDSNELSSAQPGSSGTVTVHEASCDPTPTLSIEIDGTLGSEVDQPALAIKGSYHS